MTSSRVSDGDSWTSIGPGIEPSWNIPTGAGRVGAREYSAERLTQPDLWSYIRLFKLVPRFEQSQLFGGPRGAPQAPHATAMGGCAVCDADGHRRRDDCVHVVQAANEPRVFSPIDGCRPGAGPGVRPGEKVAGRWRRPEGGCDGRSGASLRGAKRRPAVLTHGRSMWPTPRFSRRAMR